MFSALRNWYDGTAPIRDRFGMNFRHSGCAKAIPFVAMTLVALAALPAQAQDSRAPAAQPISAVRLDQYASAFVRISELRREARRQANLLPAGQQPVVKRRLAQGIAQALVRAGLTEAEFNRITKAIEGDAELWRRARQRVMEKAVGI